MVGETAAEALACDKPIALFRASHARRHTYGILRRAGIDELLPPT